MTATEPHVPPALVAMEELIRIQGAAQAENVREIYWGAYEDEGTPLARRGLVIQGPVSLCAYVGVPIDSPLAGHHYDDMPLQAHGGLTFAKEGGYGPYPPGWYWYGWDYAHLGDYLPWSSYEGHRWTVDEVKAETLDVMDRLKRLLAEVHAPLAAPGAGD